MAASSGMLSACAAVPAGRPAMDDRSGDNNFSGFHGRFPGSEIGANPRLTM